MTEVDIEQTFDPLNRITAINHHHLNKVQRQGWDAAGNRTWMSVDGIPNSTATYTWDTRNRLATIDHASMGHVAYEYNLLGQKTKLTYPNGIVRTDTYDVNGRIQSLDYRRPDTSQVFLENLTYDARSNITRRIDDEGTHQYQYDWLDQLTRAQYPDSTYEEFAYDKSGNRSSLTTAGGVATYTLDDADQLRRVDGPNAGENTVFTWTSNGEMASRLGSGATTPTSYFWSTQEMLTDVVLSDGRRIRFSYNPARWLGWRLSVHDTTESTTATLWDRESLNPIADLNQSGSLLLLRAEGRRIDEHIATNGPASSSAQVYVLDHLGSTMHVTSQESVLQASHTYRAYGSPRASSQALLSLGTNAYAGREGDSRSGLYYHRARWYVPAEAIFTVPDFLRSNFEESRYRYAANSPIYLIDPTGLQPVAPTRLPCNADQIRQRLADIDAILNDSDAGDGRGTGAKTTCDPLKCAQQDPKGKHQHCETCVGEGFGSLDPCVRKCIGLHERHHRNQCQALGCTAWLDPKLNPLKQEEDAAYAKEKQCLQELLKSGSVPADDIDLAPLPTCQ